MDDIELPPLDWNSCHGTTLAAQVRDYARAAVLADRERRKKPERVVHREKFYLWSDGIATHITYQRTLEATKVGSVVLCWTDDGRAWIESRGNKRLAAYLRGHGLGRDEREIYEAAAALDGGLRG